MMDIGLMDERAGGWMDIGIYHDTVCAGVVCAANPGTARVGPAVARPLALTISILPWTRNITQR